MSIDQVQKQFGAPDSKSTDSNGDQVWEYRKASSSRKGTNGYIRVVTLNMLSGSDSLYVDVLNITFKKKKVENYTYKENVFYGPFN